MKRLAYGIPLAFVFIFLLWLIVIPDSLIITLIENAVGDENSAIEVRGIKKGLFYNFTADEISLKKKTTLLVSAHNVRVRINPLYFFLLKLKLSFDGNIADGNISGNIELQKGKNRTEISVTGADINKLPLLGMIGIKGQGRLSGGLRLTDSPGDLRFAVDNARFEDAVFSGIQVPLGLFHTAKGAMVIGDNIEIKSFAFEGRDIYARLKGNIVSNNLDLQLELMPEDSMKADPALLLLNRFRVSGGYYLVPIKTRIEL